LSVVDWLSKSNKISKLIKKVKEYDENDNRAIETNTIANTLPELFKNIYPSINSWDSDRDGGPLPYFVRLASKELKIKEKGNSAIKVAIHRKKNRVTSSSK
jgi:hypothetical protein